MTTTTKKIFQEAVKLPAVDRAELIEQILSSFNFPERTKIDVLWAKEAESRLSAFSSGKIKAKPAKAVFEAIQRKK